MYQEGICNSGNQFSDYLIIDQSNSLVQSNIFDIISSLTPLIAIIAAIWIGLKTIRHNRLVARQIKTLEIVLDSQTSQLHKDAISVIKEHSSDPGGVAKLAGLGVQTQKKAEIEDSYKLRELLNFYESMAVGVNRKVISEEIFRLSHYSTVIKLVNILMPFIKAIREKNEQEKSEEDKENDVGRYAYENVCKLQIKWKSGEYWNPKTENHIKQTEQKWFKRPENLKD